MLELDATVRHVSEAVGVAAFVRDALDGSNALDAAQRIGGELLRGEWERRLETARRVPSPIRYIDRRSASARPSVATTVAPIMGRSGAIDAIVVTGVDRAAPPRPRSISDPDRELLESALDLSRLGRFVLDVRDGVLEVDRRYCEIFGADPSGRLSTQGRFAVLEFVHEEDRDRVSRDLTTALEGKPGVSYKSDYRIWAQHQDGPELRRIEVIRRIESDEYGVARMVGVIEDVTDRWREEELRIRMQKREAIGSLTAGLAHDFNNVLGAILSNARLASIEIDAGTSPTESIQQIAQAAHHAGALVQRMLDASRESEPTLQPIALGPLIESVVSLMRPTLPASVTLTAAVSSRSQARLLADEPQLHQVLVNLIANARDAIDKPQGHILVEAGPVAHDSLPPELRTGPADQPWVCIAIKDNGPGIPEDLRQRVFDPFFTTKPQGQGTGLGLAASLSIVRSHHGHISIGSALEGGTIMTVLLPCELDRRTPTTRIDRDEVADCSATYTVLFVDDEPALAELATRAMPAFGCAAEVFTDADNALAAFLAAPARFDILVTDLAMPGRTGLELIADVRTVRPDLPTILTSGFLNEQNSARAQALRVDEILPKPADIADIAATVRRLCASVTPPHGSSSSAIAAE
ncbi:MAG: ATP-binding protein [Patulibacter sp.]|nr:ATP-binding protein [Patulibacter sp.]